MSLEINAVLAEKIGFATHQNAVAVIRDLAVANLGEMAVNDAILELSADPPFLTAKSWPIDRIDPGTKAQISDRDVRLNATLLDGLTESIRGTLSLRLTRDGIALAERHSNVELLARSEWGGGGTMGELLAAFAMPNDPAVDKLVKAASDVLRRAGKPDAINGYESKSRERVWSFASALWSGVAGLRLSYALPPASFETQGQKVRSPSAILEGRVATCLDTALLFSAALEQMGLHPLIILTRGHAFVGLWLTPREFVDVATDEAAALRRRIDLGEMILFETTLAAQSPIPGFQQAIAAAKRLIDPEKDGEFQQAIDIRRARLQKIRPLASIGSMIHADSQTTDIAAEALEEPPPLPGFDESLPSADPQSAGITDRIQVWQRKLLDLTARNRLLNLPSGSSSMALICPDPAALEDRLAQGKAIKILPMPPLNVGGRDSALYEQQNRASLREEVAHQALARDELLGDADAERHEKMLVELYRKSRSDLSEGGANTLFLALGFLNWRKLDNDTRIYRAPLILLPVKLERQSVRSGFRLRQHEDEPRFNLTLLELLRQDFGLDIPGLNGALPGDETGIDVHRVWGIVRHAIRDSKGFEVVPDMVLGTFSFAKYLMWKDLVDRSAMLKQSAVVRHLIDRRDESYAIKGTFTPPLALDQRIDPAKLFAPLPADSSQLAAVVASADGMDFVLDGPPGTGKSQTIANMIAHNLALGRRVLFVAEKMAALNVVYRRLEERGLGSFCLELHSSKATKTEVLQQLDRAWDTADTLSPDAWAREAGEVRRLRDSLNDLVALLHRRWPNGLTLHDAIGRVVRDGDDATPRFEWPAGTVHDDEAMAQMRGIVGRLALNAQPVAALMGPLSALVRTDWSNTWQEALLAAAAAFLAALDSLAAARAAAQRASQISNLGGDAAQDTQLVQVLEALQKAHGLDLRFAFAPDASARIEAAQQALGKIAAYRAAETKLSAAYPPEAARRIDVPALAGAWAQADKKFWPLSIFAKKAVVATLLSQGGASAKPDAARDLPILQTLRDLLSALDALAPQLGGISGWSGVASDPDRIKKATGVAAELRNALTQAAATPDMLAELRRAASSLALDANELLAPDGALALATAHLRAASTKAANEIARFRDLAGCDTNDSSLLAALAQAVLTHRTQLNAWCSWCRARDEALSRGLHRLVEQAQQGSDDLKSTFETGYARWFAAWLIDSEPRIRNFVAAEHMNSIEAFRKLDDRLAELSVRYIRTQLAQGIPRKDENPRSDGFAVLRHQLQLQKRHKPIRQLIGEMGAAFTKLAPCMLMSPLSIAQYLPADQPPFDLVIFDEASQITPWDAIGAIARGKQLVVAGDHRQMPPTSFFTRGSAPADDEAEDDMESILDECKGAGLPTISLTWHYRSRHESLITFSNHRYYDGNLVTFPAAITKASAVNWRKIDGVYAKGAARTNALEAKAVVEEVVTRLRAASGDKRPQSIAIVTLNAEQQILIEDLLDKAKRSYPEIEPFFGDAMAEPVVVKNLETVQGDERDVILLSIGYGPTEPNAKVMSMNFGPLNREGGWRRLNVAITRARHEMVVFSSFEPSLVDLNRTAARAVRDLKHFLEFADKGPRAITEAVTGSVGGHESPFESAVADALTRKGWQVVPQIGVSRFRIDLGIVHPDRPGDYLVGVECDGAMYHSAATARDRDKIRAGILQGLGWQLVRVWSTDWWVDKNGALQRLDDAIRQILLDMRAKAATEQPQSPDLDVLQGPDPEADADIGPNAAPEPNYANLAEPSASLFSSVEATDYRLADLGAFADKIERERFEDIDYLPTLEKLIAYILEAEAPILDELLVVRIARAHGFARAGERIRDRILKIAKKRHHIRKDLVGGRFVWTNAEAPVGFSKARRPRDEASLRSIDEISSEELCAAASCVTGADIPTEVARFFGNRRLSSAARLRIQQARAKTLPNQPHDDLDL